MKTQYIIAKSYIDIKPVLEKALPLLKGKVGILTTIQFLHLMDDVKKYLDSKNIKNETLGQILGCNIDVAKNSKSDTFLFIGDGAFHPKGFILKQKKEIVIANPISTAVSKLGEEEIKKIENTKYRGLAKFHSSKEIGVLVTLKPGQEHLMAALSLKKKFPDKNFYVLVFDDLDYSQLENFNFIECFVNTMCPRISYDDSDKLPKAVIDYQELQ